MTIIFNYNAIRANNMSEVHYDFTLCCLLENSFHGSGFVFLFQDTSGLRTANLKVYSAAPPHPNATHTYSGISCNQNRNITLQQKAPQVPQQE
jgi:hypothetical protein